MSYIAVEWCADSGGVTNRSPKTPATAAPWNLIAFLTCQLLLVTSQLNLAFGRRERRDQRGFRPARDDQVQSEHLEQLTDAFGIRMLRAQAQQRDAFRGRRRWMRRRSPVDQVRNQPVGEHGLGI